MYVVPPTNHLKPRFRPPEGHHNVEEAMNILILQNKLLIQIIRFIIPLSLSSPFSSSPSHIIIQTFQFPPRNDPQITSEWKCHHHQNGSLGWPPSTRPQQLILLTIQTHVLDDGNETTMVLLGLSNAGAENAQKGGAGNTSSWDRGVDLGGRGEWLSGWDRGGATGACCR